MAGIVVGRHYVGGLVGRNADQGKIEHSFYLATERNNGLGKAISAEDFKKLYTFNQWDIDDEGGTSNVWRIYDGETAPLLRSFLKQKNINAVDKTTTYNGKSQSLDAVIGFDLDDSYVPDGISFLETSLKGISGQKAIKPIPKPLVKMLDETFHYNNKFLHIVAAYHKIPKASLEYILIKVRQNLIQDFQKKD